MFLKYDYMKDLQNFKKPKVLFFDINETILNLASLKTEMNSLFGQNVFDLWFTKLLHESLVLTVTEMFESFSWIAANALKQVSAITGISINDEVFVKLIDSLSSLPPYPDVTDALEMLRRKGYVTVALSNSSKPLLEKQLENARIDSLFNEQISVELLHKYKPHKRVYQEAARLLNAKEEECMLVAAHDWDVFGALCSGLRATFIKREQQKLYSLSLKPELELEDLLSLAKKL